MAPTASDNAPVDQTPGRAQEPPLGSDEPSTKRRRITVKGCLSWVLGTVGALVLLVVVAAISAAYLFGESETDSVPDSSPEESLAACLEESLAETLAERLLECDAAPLPAGPEGGFNSAYVTQVIKDATGPSVSGLDDIRVMLNSNAGLVRINFNPSLWNETDALTEGSYLLFRAARGVFGRVSEANAVQVYLYASLTDEFGVARDEVVVFGEVSRETANRFSYDGLESRIVRDNKLMFCNSDRYNIHPTVYAKLKDRGCLISSQK